MGALFFQHRLSMICILEMMHIYHLKMIQENYYFAYGTFLSFCFFAAAISPHPVANYVTHILSINFSETDWKSEHNLQMKFMNLE